MFRDAVSYIVEQNKLVGPLYELEKEGKLTGEGDKGLEGRPFLDGQLVKAGQMLGDIWYTAWLEAPEDQYLQRSLQERNAASRRKEREARTRARRRNKLGCVRGPSQNSFGSGP